jgi:hypothetical protein
MCQSKQDTHTRFRVLADACSLVFALPAQVPYLPRNISQWSDTQKKSYHKVALRFQQEAATYYTLLALGVAGAVKLADYTKTLNTAKDVDVVPVS